MFRQTQLYFFARFVLLERHISLVVTITFPQQASSGFLA